MNPYSLDLRQRVINDCLSGMGTKQVAKKYSVGLTFVRKLKKQHYELGHVEPLKPKRDHSTKLDQYVTTLINIVHDRPDATLKEIAEQLPIEVSGSAIGNMLKRLGITRKKKVFCASEQRREDVQEQRRQWQEQAADWDVNRLVFIDETGTRTDMTRSHGRCPKGKRLIEHVPKNRWQSSTLVSAMRVDGLSAEMVIDGAMNTVLFLAFLRQILLPTLRPGDIVIMDNLSSHKSREVQEILAEAGARAVYLPPYSPDLNPIELVFSKLKWLLRTAKLRLAESIWSYLGTIYKQFSPEECRKYFRHCGYQHASIAAS